MDNTGFVTFRSIRSRIATSKDNENEVKDLKVIAALLFAGFYAV